MRCCVHRRNCFTTYSYCFNLDIPSIFFNWFSLILLRSSLLHHIIMFIGTRLLCYTALSKNFTALSDSQKSTYSNRTVTYSNITFRNINTIIFYTLHLHCQLLSIIKLCNFIILLLKSIIGY